MRRVVLALAALFLLAAPLFLLLRGFARDVVVVELLRFLWAARLVYDSLPQAAIWAAFLVFVLIMATRSLVGRRELGPAQRPEEASRPGQVQRLAGLIRKANQGEYFQSSLAQHLAELTAEVMAYQERTTPELWRRRLKAGETDLPPRIGDYLADRKPRLLVPSGFLSWLWPARPSPTLDPILEDVTRFLEEQLEVKHDDESRRGF